MQRYIELLFGIGIYLYSFFLLKEEKLDSLKCQVLLCASVIIGICIGKLGSGFMLPYLMAQSISDKKDKTVFFPLNITAIGCSVIYSGITWWMLPVCAGVFLLSFKFGSGDIKGILAISILLRQNTFRETIFLLLLFLLFSELIFIIYRFIKRIPKKERTAFFPAMTGAYCILLSFL